MTKILPLTVRELELWNAFLPARGLDARHALVENYQPFVQSVAERLKSTVAVREHEELVNDGQRGLLSAIDGFNLSLRKRFTTYARPRVRGAMIDGIRNRDRLTKGGRTWQRRIDEAHAAAVGKMHAPANASDVARELSLSDEALSALHRTCVLVTRSLSDPVGQGGKVIELADVLPDHREAEPADVLQRQMLWEMIAKHCSLAECQILEMRYREERTFEAIGLALGKSTFAVWQTHNSLIGKLRRLFQGRADEFV